LNLHIPAGRVFPATPSLFNTNSLEFDYDPGAAVPEKWLRFLAELWDGDAQSVQLLQEWFGYCLTADTSQQKMLLLLGPRRCGKGTIGRVLTRLVGAGNVAGPTTSSLAGPFGLQPLIGKSLAIVSDARFSGDDIAIVTERLLCISGEDTLTIDRKHVGSVTMKLPTRFMFLTNELPRVNDASGALAGRFMVLRFIKSFYGHEDKELTGKLLSELPGILLWALQGWQRLRERGRFMQPAGVEDAIGDLEDLFSPVGAFVRDRCAVGLGKTIESGQLFDAWRDYCRSIGRVHVGTIQTFGRDLRAVLPGLRISQPRMAGGRMRWYEGIALAGAQDDTQGVAQEGVQ
jgi:putative DNA primase/helicase